MRPTRRVALSITLGRHLCRQAGSPSYMVLKQIHEADNCKKLSFQQFRQTVFNTCTASNSTAANASIMRSSTYMYLGLTLDTVQVILTSIYLYLLILTCTWRRLQPKPVHLRFPFSNVHTLISGTMLQYLSATADSHRQYRATLCP